MIELEFGKKYEKPMVLALGMFDCVHLAHLMLIKEAKTMAKKAGALSAVFTFTEISPLINKGDKLLYTYQERLLRFIEEGVDMVVYKKASDKFAKLSALEFLEILSKSLKLIGLICGEDFQFGKGAAGDVNLLSLYCQKNNIKLKIVKTVYVEGVKVSTSNVKQLLAKGAIEEANALLVKPYKIAGKVIKGLGLGKFLMFATANIKPDKSKALILCGVYYTNTEIDGIKYKSVTNFGNKPTLNNKTETLCETHILGYSGNLYGKIIVVEFLKRIRGIEKFGNTKDLKIQIEKDIEFAKNN